MLFIVVLFEFFEQFLCGGTKNIMNPMDLIKFIISWEQWKKGEHLKENTANTPIVHFMIIITVGQ
jgi:hypothetical protein